MKEEIMKIDNPVARLYDLLIEGKKKNVNESCKDVWMALLGAKNESELFSKLSLVLTLPEKINTVLSQSASKEDYATQYWENQIDAAFSNQSLISSWSTFINRIDNNALTELRLLKTIVNTKGAFEKIDDKDLFEVKSQLSALLDEIIESDLNQAVKEKICKYLRKIISTIEDYKISGIEPIMDAINTTMGNAFFDSPYRTFLSENSLGGKIIKCISAIADSITTIQGLPPVATLAIELFNRKNTDE
ncbi:hypothetical protein ACYDMH_11430 [Pectobacterium brasiliense]|uniref:hypothetical protein n=1 Tax=Pectobacterium brasiliense TaxID=180957 RepID=UPI00057F02F5|nr:hypothetical protein [Pectobacterium brasiliense]KHS89281.1 hypothetical protein RC83_05140 [Pectobacterium brasiliense]MDY4325312.1 hypothetical protein [Pectobacterium brasiliense]